MSFFALPALCELVFSKCESKYKLQHSDYLQASSTQFRPTFYNKYYDRFLCEQAKVCIKLWVNCTFYLHKQQDITTSQAHYTDTHPLITDRMQSSSYIFRVKREYMQSYPSHWSSDCDPTSVRVDYEKSGQITS